MTRPAVVEHSNIVNDVFSSIFSGFIVGKKDSPGFQASEKAFRYRIVPAIPLATHTAYHSVRLQHTLKVRTAILAATIGMED